MQHIKISRVLRLRYALNSSKRYTVERGNILVGTELSRYTTVNAVMWVAGKVLA